MKKYLIGIVIVLAVVIVFLAIPKSQPLGGYLTSTVTNSSSSVGVVDTIIVAAGANLQRIVITNLGTGSIHCAFGTTSTLTTGLKLNGTGSSTLTSVDITDANLLGKTMRCIADVTSTVSVLKY